MRRQNRATIQQVAMESGVSTATVSYVINNGPRPVKPETRERVLATIARLEYHPSALARGLARKRTDSIGVVLPHRNSELVMDPYFSAVLDGIIRVATREQQNVTLFTGLEWHTAKTSLARFLAHGVDGLLLLATPIGTDMVATLTEHRVPFVWISGTSADPRSLCIDVDNRAAAVEAVGHLIELGHRRIAFLGGQPQSPSSRHRLQGYVEALHAHDIPVGPEMRLEGQFSEWWGTEGMRRLLTLPDPPTAVFAGNDSIAVGAYRACRELGRRVPDYVSIVGFDDVAHAAHMDPPLTTVRQPLGEMGALAVEMLLKRLEVIPTDEAMPPHVCLPTQLVPRSSTTAPRAQLLS